MGYGGYGMSKWGADPGAGYMAGLGSFARSQGVYQLEKAKADAINVETMIKWNKALRARQQVPPGREAEGGGQGGGPARGQASRDPAGRRDDPQSRALSDPGRRPGRREDGTIEDPAQPAAIREIPFEWDSEAITVCLDQMTGQGSLPDALMAPRYAGERDELHAAVAPALKEDAKGKRAPRRRASTSTRPSHTSVPSSSRTRPSSIRAIRTASITSPRSPASPGCSATRA